MPACSAAPIATTSSGFTPLWASLPPVSFLTRSWTAGIRVNPPTKTTSSISAGFNLASFSACLKGPSQRSSKSAVILFISARVRVMSRWRGPSAVAVTKGRFMLVVCAVESSHLAFSAASFNLCIAILSFRKSTPCFALKSSAIQFMMRSSQSSPPKWVSPLVALTSKSPSEMSRIETSKVPPPRSKTRMVCSFSLSKPYAREAAVGSLMILNTSRPAILPASLVAVLWASSK